MAKRFESGIDYARMTFSREGLTPPPVPERFKKQLRVLHDWCLATRMVSAMGMYFFDEYIKEALTTDTSDYVAFCHAGHGVNSYALTYQLVYGPLAILAQVGWGGGYSDRGEDTRQANALFARCAELISATERARARGLSGPPGRLFVIESEMLSEYAWGWLDRPLSEKAYRGWRDGHFGGELTQRSRSRRPTLPTVAALKWLNAAPGPARKRSPASKPIPKRSL